jgi:hypothetical protein
MTISLLKTLFQGVGESAFYRLLKGEVPALELFES